MTERLILKILVKEEELLVDKNKKMEIIQPKKHKTKHTLNLIKNLSLDLKKETNEFVFLDKLRHDASERLLIALSKSNFIFLQ